MDLSFIRSDIHPASVCAWDTVTRVCMDFARSLTLVASFQINVNTKPRWFCILKLISSHPLTSDALRRPASLALASDSLSTRSATACLFYLTAIYYCSSFLDSSFLRPGFQYTSNLIAESAVHSNLDSGDPFSNWWKGKSKTGAPKSLPPKISGQAL